MTRRSLILLILTVTATIAPMATARACSCMIPDAAQFLQDSDFVFAGSLLDRPGDPIDGGFENVAYTFEVDAVYKGDIRDQTIEVWSASNGAACGFEMALGEPVAIAASFSGGQLTGSLCATFGVAELEAAATDAGIDPTIPDPTTREPDVVAPPVDEQTDGGTMSTVVVMVGVLVAAGAAGVVLVRRRGREA